jgi:hypothetical protein
MRERPMLYSTPMAQATIEGRKTKTRRTKGLELVNNNPDEWKLSYLGMFEHPGSKSIPKMKPWKAFGATFTWKPYRSNNFLKCPYQPGDVIWVRETWAIQKYFNGLMENSFPLFRTNYDAPVDWNWMPSIFMKKIHARIWLQVIDIKVERLQDITEEEAIAEGVKHAHDFKQPNVKIENFPDGSKAYHNTISFRRGFLLLWNEINGDRAWNLNPWVWVISFKVLSTTGRPLELDQRFELKGAAHG